MLVLLQVPVLLTVQQSKPVHADTAGCGCIIKTSKVLAKVIGTAGLITLNLICRLCPLRVLPKQLCSVTCSTSTYPE